MRKNQLWARKPFAKYEQEIQESGLRRVLGKWELTALGVGAVIGAGIFVITGLAAKEYAGPALAISFVVAGLGCTFAALCYAEFASILPVEGSAYSYSYATIGELFAWDLILEYAMSSGTVAVGWSGYFARLLGLFDIHFPIWLMNDIYTAKYLLNEATLKNTLADLSGQYPSLVIPEIFNIPFAINLPAIAIVVVVTAILVVGVREASGTNLVAVVIKVAVVLFVIIVGVFFIDPSNWTPFVPARGLNSGGNPAIGFMGIMAGAAYVFFAYIGFDAVSTQAGEAINPKKTVLFGIIVSLVVCTVLYILVCLIITGMVKYTELDVTAPIAFVFASKGLNFAVWFIDVAAVVGLTSVLLVILMTQSRLFYAMAKDGLLPRSLFGVLHKRFKTPYKGTILTGAAVMIVAGFTPIETIVKLVNIGTLFAFVMVCIAVLILRYKQPELERPFKVKFLPWIASLGIVFSLGMMLSLEVENWLRLLIWLLMGLVVYFIYSKKHSAYRS